MINDPDSISRTFPEQFVLVYFLPNNPFHYVGAKLSRCQIVRFFYIGALFLCLFFTKLYVFTTLVQNCRGVKLFGAKFSVFFYLGALFVCLLFTKLYVFTMLVPDCQGVKLCGAKLSFPMIVFIDRDFALASTYVGSVLNILRSMYNKKHIVNTSPSYTL